MSVGHLHVPGDAARREYAVYLVVATHRRSGQRRLYVGKTGDNRDGCNPMVSRAGNHFSYNRLHSQLRNHLKPDDPGEYDFDYFYTTFGPYLPPGDSRDGIDVINEMERRLNRAAQDAFGAILNPYKGAGYVNRRERDRRAVFASADRLEQLDRLIAEVRSFLGAGGPPMAVVELDDGPTGGESGITPPLP